jgi:TFIIF-interacting CTD phosphatase-like protein
MKEGNFVKELSTVETDMARVVIVDNSPIAYALNRGAPY